MADSRSIQFAWAASNLLHLGAVIVLACWGLASFALPWPGLAIGPGAALFVVLLWGLFLSPRAVLRVDRFVRALVEIVIATAAGLALLDLGLPWLAGAFVLAATALGVAAGARSSER